MGLHIHMLLPHMKTENVLYFHLILLVKKTNQKKLADCDSLVDNVSEFQNVAALN